MKLVALIALPLAICMLFYRQVSTAAEIPAVGQAAPAFSLPDQTGQQHSLSDYQGSWVVLYFYPKDDTPGCTKEACHFRDDLFKLEKLGAKVIGVSVDDSDSHAEFARKYHLPFPLLADKKGKIADDYGALRNFGIMKFAKRYTFLIDPQGKIAKTYLDVDTSRHSQQIIDDLQKMTTAG